MMNKLFCFLLAIALGIAHPMTSTVLSIASIFGMYGALWFLLRYQSRRICALTYAILFTLRFEWFLRPEYHGIFISLAFLFVVLLYAFVWFRFTRTFIFEERAWPFIAKIILFELAMSYFLCGFTIDQVGVQALALPSLATKASLVGGLGLSVIILYLNTQVYFLLRAKDLRWQSLALALLLSVVALGPIGTKGSEGDLVSISLMQTGLRPEEKRLIPGKERALWSMRRQWDQIIALVQSADDSECMIFPEVTVPHLAYAPLYDLEEATALLRKHYPKGEAAIQKASITPFVYQESYATNAFFFQVLAEVHDCAIIAGLCDERAGKNYSSAFCFTPGEPPQVYDKQVLVPVAEAAPLPLFSFISQEYGIQEYFTPGSGKQVFRYKGLCIQPAICYDEMIDRVMMRRRGVNLFVSLSNDAWYPSSSLPGKHAAMGAMRALENGVTVVRSTNTGLTGSFDMYGFWQIDTSLSEWKQGVVTVVHSLNTVDTLYMIWGNYPLLLISIGVIVLDLIRKKKVSLSNEPMKLTD